MESLIANNTFTHSCHLALPARALPVVSSDCTHHAARQNTTICKLIVAQSDGQWHTCVVHTGRQRLDSDLHVGILIGLVFHICAAPCCPPLLPACTSEDHLNCRYCALCSQQALLFCIYNTHQGCFHGKLQQNGSCCAWHSVEVGVAFATPTQT